MSAGQKTILYVHHGRVPEEVRAEKICASLVKAGFRVIILSRWIDEPTEREELKGFVISRVGFQKSGIFSIGIPGNPNWTRAIKNHINEFSPSIIICREMLLMRSCHAASRDTRIPLILDMAEHYPAAMREWKKYKSNPITSFIVNSTPVLENIESYAVSKAQAIITVCIEQKERLIKQFKVPQQNIFIVHNTPESTLFDSVRKGCNNPPIVLGHHGYFTLERNLETLVKGFDIAAMNYPSLELVLAGHGETYNDVFTVAQSLSSKKRIHFTGPYKAQDLFELYSNTDIGILPYAEQEFRQHTLPNKVFDYMACGKPIISSALKPMKRLLNETGAGIIGDCSTPESIAKLIDSIMNADTKSMANNGIVASKSRYNWEFDEGELLKCIKRSERLNS